MSKQYTVKVWWSTGRPDNQALVLAKLPYTGRYTEYFDAVLRLENPKTRKGWTEHVVKLSDIEFKELV